MRVSLLYQTLRYILVAGAAPVNLLNRRASLLKGTPCSTEGVSAEGDAQTDRKADSLGRGVWIRTRAWNIKDR